MQRCFGRDYIFGSSFKGAYEHPHYPGDKENFFVLDTKTDTQEEFATYDELQRQVSNLGARLDLRPIFDVYEQFRYTWFDRLVAILMFVPPGVVFVCLIAYVVILKKRQVPRKHLE